MWKAMTADEYAFANAGFRHIPTDWNLSRLKCRRDYAS